MAGQTVVVSVLADTKKFASGLNETTGHLDNLGKGLKNFGAAAGVAFAAAGAAATVWITTSAKALIEIEKLNAQTQAAITSTGGAAGRSLKQINDLNGSLETLTGIETEVIQKGQNILLTFTNIKGDQFDEATKAALDMSVALGTDMASAAMSIGKAINDPVEGISKLTRVGVTFSEEQKKTIAALQETGDVAGAQGIILQELQKEFGGSAEAFGKTTAGQIAKVKNSFGTLGETIAAGVLPALNEVLPKITEFLDQLNADPQFIKFTEDLGKAFTQIFMSVLPLLQPLAQLVQSFLPIFVKLIAAIAPLVSALIVAFIPLIDAVLPILGALFDALLPVLGVFIDELIKPLIPLLVELITGFMPLIQMVLPPLLALITAIIPVVMSLFRAFLPLIQLLLPPLIKYFLVLLDPLLDLLNKILPGLIPLIEGFGKILGWLLDTFITPLIDGLSAVVGWFQQLFGFDGKTVNVTGKATGISTNRDGSPNRDGDPLTPFALGGIVRRPTAALIGEAGPEAVIPLAKLEKIMAQSSGTTVVVQGNVGWDPEALARKVAQKQRQAYAMAGLNGMIGVA